MLENFPRERFAHLPTPLEPLNGLRNALDEALGEACPRLLIKRDDCTGLGFGGNKTRKLEFLVGQAKAEGNDTLITFGALQSNHVRQTAAAAARAGLSCIAILVEQVPYQGGSYTSSGNVMLDGLFGAELHRVADNEGAGQALGAVLERLGHEGRSALIIPPGGSTAIGALGYVDCALELEAQCKAQRIKPTALVMASSTGGTQAGLVTGFAAAQFACPVIGFDVYAGNPEKIAGDVTALAGEVAGLLPNPPTLHPDAVDVRDGVIGPGYGLPTDEMKEAVDLLATRDGVLIDPVYSGKAMAGLIQMIRVGAFSPDDTIVFLHTGGAPGLFAYEGEWR
ncbi:MAG: D-cysteine desulfhydrase family protein [Alphaproteobacteria bacterium]